MGIDRHPDINPEGVAEDDIGCFPCHASEFEEVFHGVGDLAVEVLDDHGHGGVDGFGFIAEEADCFDPGFYFFGR